jgi:hypothetical protein
VCVRECVVCERERKREAYERQRLIALGKSKAFWLVRFLQAFTHHSSKTPSNSLIEWEGGFYDVSEMEIRGIFEILTYGPTDDFSQQIFHVVII